MTPYTVETYENRHDWLVARKRGLGGSDAPAVLGLSRFRGGYSVATDKLTEAVDDAREDEMAEWGHRLEPAIAAKFLEATGNRTVDPGDYTIYRSSERPHLFCTPDRLVYEKANNPSALLDTKIVGVLELKTAHFESGKEWAERVPLGYQCQLQHSMYVLDVKQGYFAVLIDGYRFKWHPVKRNDRWINTYMLPRLDAFWAAIERKEWPDVDESEATAAALARRYHKPEPKKVDLPLDYETLGQEYDAILATERELDKKKRGIQNRIKEAIGDGEVGVLMDLSGFSWKANGNGVRRFARVEKVGGIE